MIDFFKAIVKDSKIDTVSSVIDFKEKVDVSTGELIGFQEGRVKGLDVRVYDSGFLIIKGSLHKFFNDGKHNYNQFGYEDVRRCLEMVALLVNADLEEMILQNLEFGFNLQVAFPPKDAIDGFVYHRGVVPDISFGGHCKEFKHSEYSIKVYDKSFHYGLGNRVLRCELKVIKSRKINSLFDVFNMADLLEIANLERAKNSLIKAISETIRCYPLKVDSVECCDWTSSRYWERLEKRKRYQERQSFELWKSKQEPDMPPLSPIIEDKLEELTSSLFV